MDKNTYLKELSRHLARHMPKQELEDTLRWYEEYFQEAGPEREAEIIEELGSPDALASRLAREGGWSEKKTPSSKWKPLGIALAVLLLLGALSIGVWTALRGNPGDSASNPNVGTGREDPADPSDMLQGPDSPAPSESPEPSGALEPSGTPDSSGTSGPSQDPGSSQSQEADSSPDQVLDAFTEIEADISVGDITVRTGDEFRIEVEVRGAIDGEPYRIEYKVDGGVLNIVSFPKYHDHDGHDTNSCSARVSITIPEDRVLDEIDLDAGVGDLTVRGLSVDQVELEAGVGDLSVIDTAADSVELQTGVGEVRLTGAPAEEMELTTGVGNIHAELACAPEECRYQLTSGVGSIRVNGVTTLLSASQSAPNAPYRLTGSTGVGEVTLTTE